MCQYIAPRGKKGKGEKRRNEQEHQIPFVVSAPQVSFRLPTVFQAFKVIRSLHCKAVFAYQNAAND
jgi:hypothetical protein